MCRCLLKSCPGFRPLFFLVYFFERTRPAARMRPPCLIYLSTSSYVEGSVINSTARSLQVATHIYILNSTPLSLQVATQIYLLNLLEAYTQAAPRKYVAGTQLPNRQHGECTVNTSIPGVWVQYMQGSGERWLWFS